jgi:hypothetical protein
MKNRGYAVLPGDFLYRYEVAHLIDHSHDLGGCLLDHAVADPAQAERFYGIFLALGAIYDAAHLGDFDLCHVRYFLSTFL